MAQTNKEVSRVFGFLSILLLIQKGHAFEFKVGGSKGWTVPTDPNAAIYNQWAEKNRFQIGDTLLFVYSADQDSVLHVTKDDYTNCNTQAPLEKFTDGHTVFKFNQSGACYFISGVVDNCHKNEKLVVVVMADRSNSTKHNSNGTEASPPPSPSVEVPPPSPAPASEESPSPPPSGEETNPTPAPSEESSPPKNGASSIVTNVIGTIAGFIGSSLVLAI